MVNPLATSFSYSLGTRVLSCAKAPGNGGLVPNFRPSGDSIPQPPHF